MMAGRDGADGAGSSQPQHAKSHKKEPAAAQEYKQSRGNKAAQNGQVTKFHPNMHGEASVVSFINEKPGTSDINQPSNRKIRVNRKL